MNLIPLCAAAALMLAGALSPAFATATGQDVTYRCDGRKTITVTYTGAYGDVAVFEDAGESIMLKHVRRNSGSGVLYRTTDPNYDYKLVAKGKTATFYANGKPFMTNCKAR